MINQIDLKVYRDLKGVIDTAFEEGKLEGQIKRNIEIAKALKSRGISIQIISQTTGLTIEEIEKLS
jgi:predicted transposase/invertase (TIGR01784 family)